LRAYLKSDSQKQISEFILKEFFADMVERIEGLKKDPANYKLVSCYLAQMNIIGTIYMDLESQDLPKEFCEGFQSKALECI